MIRTRLMSFIILSALMFTLAGCGLWVSGQSDGGKIKLTLWYWNRSISDEVMAKAKEHFPDLEINAQKIGGDFKAKLKTTLAAGSGGPDIVALNSWVNELFPDKNVFVNLYDLGAKELQDQYLDWKWQQGVTPEGYMIGFPMDTGPTALFYRADLFEKAGLPTDPEEVTKSLSTWDQYFDAGKRLKAAFTGGQKVYLTDSITSVYSQVLAQGKGLYFDDSDRFVGDRSEQVKKSWGTAIKARKEGLLANIDQWTPEWNAAMNKGDIASFVGAVWMKAVLSDAAPDTAGKWRVARTPEGDGNNGGSFMGILKQSKHPEKSFEVIKYLQSAQMQLQDYQDVDLFPSTPEVYSDPNMMQPESFYGGQVTGKVFSESAQNVKVAYFGPYYTLVDGIFKSELNEIAKQHKDPKKAWKDAIHKINRELSH